MNNSNLVGGFNPSEKYESKWESLPNRDENKKYLKPPPSSNWLLHPLIAEILGLCKDNKKELESCCIPFDKTDSTLLNKRRSQVPGDSK